MTASRPSTQTVLLAAVLVILGAVALRGLYVVVLPLLLAALLAAMVRPIQLRLRAWLPASLGPLAMVPAMLLILGVMALIVGVFWVGIRFVVANAPTYAQALAPHWDGLVAWADRHGLPIPSDAARSQRFLQSLVTVLTFGVQKTLSVVTILVATFFFVLLILLEADEWQAKWQDEPAGSTGATTLETIASVARTVRRFLLFRFLLNVAAGATATAWLWLTGVDHALLWGLLVFVLSFIPYLGPMAAVIPPALTALAQYGLDWALVVLAGMFVIEFLMSYLLDPRVMGRALDISPVVLLLAVLFWGWLWGVAGALLAVPLTVTVLSICDHAPSLQPVAELLRRRKPSA